MRSFQLLIIALCAAFIATPAFADASGELIMLDKVWGSARSPADVKNLLSDNFISVGEDGVSNKAELMKAMAEDSPSDEPYVAAHYKVEFLDDKTAIMVHSVADDDDTHWSLHVWRKNGGKWQVAATASVEADD